MNNENLMDISVLKVSMNVLNRNDGQEQVLVTLQIIMIEIFSAQTSIKNLSMNPSAIKHVNRAIMSNLASFPLTLAVFTTFLHAITHELCHHGY